MSRRIRTVKPELLDDDKTAALSHVAWRLFVSGLLLSDDHGNLRAGTTYLLGQVFHSTGSTAEEVRAAVAELVALELWTTYTVRGQTYAHICGWSKHQRIDNAGKPKVPTPSEADETLPASDEAKNKVRRESPRVAASRRESPRFAEVRRGSRLEGEREREEDQGKGYPPPPLGGKAREGAPVCVRGDSNPPDLPTAHEPPPSAKTAPCALPADEDDPTGPLTSRGASLPLFRATAPTTPPAPSPAPLPPAPVASPAPVVVVAPEPCPAPPPPASASPGLDPAEATPAPSPSAAGSDPEPEESPTVRGAVGEVFAHWSRVVWANAHVAPKLTKERRARIRARLAEGYTVADLCLALDGVRHDPWLMGTADGARPGGYRDVMTVLRDGAQVERLMGLAKQHAPKPKAPPPSDRETLRPLTPAQEAFLARGDALGPRPEFLALGRNLPAAFMSGALGLGCGAPRPEAPRG